MKGNWKPDKYNMVQADEILGILKKLRFKSVLELGCGFGRITKLILDNFDVEYTAVDMSPEQIGHVKNDFENVNIVVDDITTMPENFFKDYDLVISVEFLMHIKPEHIEKVFRIINNSAIRHIVNMDYAPVAKVKRQLSPHNFIHDYLKLYAGIRRPAKEYRFYPFQCIYYV